MRYPDLDEGAKPFKALADETRLSIIRQLAEQREVCGCDFLACSDLAQPTVSHHLNVLREVGLVNTADSGPFRTGEISWRSWRSDTNCAPPSWPPRSS